MGIRGAVSVGCVQGGGGGVGGMMLKAEPWTGGREIALYGLGGGGSCQNIASITVGSIRLMTLAALWP